MASAISVGVMSSSPAPSATEFTSAIAFRIRLAAARSGIEGAPLLCRRLAGPDDDAPFRLCADAAARDVGVAFEREVDGAALERLHGVKSDRVAGHLHLARRSHRDLTHRVLPALPVPLYVHDDPLAFGQVAAHHHVRD